MSASKITSKNDDISAWTALGEIRALLDRMGIPQKEFTLEFNCWIEDEDGVSYRIDTRLKTNGVTLS
jgi:hypothetical protein